MNGEGFAYFRWQNLNAHVEVTEADLETKFLDPLKEDVRDLALGALLAPNGTVASVKDRLAPESTPSSSYRGRDVLTLRRR